MTVFVSLSGTRAPPASPPTLKQTQDCSKYLERVAKTIVKARRVVVVCGAGISVQAGIPDFRSPDGLFQQLKREHPREGLSSGRELFDASVFHSESTASMFYKMIGRLSQMTERAQPTPFHDMLKALGDRNQLLRCYTQNIDCIEERAGLSLGVPLPQTRKRSPKKPKSTTNPTTSSTLSGDVSSETNTDGKESHSPTPSRTSTPPSTPPVDTTPQCIPLHGTLKTMHCQACGATAPLTKMLPSFEDGSIPACMQCSEFEHTRQLVGKRLRGVGIMRPSIVLYGEDHREGESVGEVVKRDLTGGRTRRAPPDLLLVAGTSLRVPGTKRIVKEFSKAARSGVNTGDSPSSSPSAEADEDRPIRTIYLNLDFPCPAREWESTFDVWVQGDVQELARKVREMMIKQDAARKSKGVSSSRSLSAGEKRKREAEEDEGSASLSAALATSSISKKPRKIEDLVWKFDSTPTPNRTYLQAQAGTDIFGPKVPMTVTPLSRTNSMMTMTASSSSGETHSGTDIRASIYCGVKRTHSLPYQHTFPLGSVAGMGPRTVVPLQHSTGSSSASFALANEASRSESIDAVV